MDERLLDMRAKPCPQPVIETRKVLLEEGPPLLRVLVDNQASAENVGRMVRSLGMQIRVQQEAPGEIHLVITPGASAAEAAGSPAAEPGEACRPASRVAVLISSDRFGAGEEELGKILMRAFVKTLHEVVPQPHVVIFLNSGINLTVEGSDLLDDLRHLAEGGVRILSCGTCLDYHRVKEKLAVGAVTNMFEVVSELTSADRVVRP